MKRLGDQQSARVRRSKSGSGALLGSFLAGSLLVACGDATDIERLEIGGTGVLFGQAYLDLDGDGQIGAEDQPIAGADVILLTSTSAEVVQLATTDADGVFTLFEVPVGSYRLTLDSASVGDSLEAVGPAEPITISLGDTSLVALGVTYPTRSIEQIADEAPGSRLFTSGIALNARLNFDPTGQVHFAGSSAFLRALNVERSGVSAGDSVRLLGRVVTDNGRPALDIVTPTVVVAGAALPLPRETTPGVAAIADGGALDAALVRVRNVSISDTSTSVGGDFRFRAVDGADSVEVVLRSFLGFGTAGVDTIVGASQITGLLSPVEDGTGAVRWRILPRGAGDLTIQTKLADVAVSVSVDRTTANVGDVVEVTVVASNAGPWPATSFDVGDTYPAALTYVSSTQTAGSYADASGVWSIAALDPGQADTLSLRLEVTDGTPATLTIGAQSLGLTFEQDPNPANDSDTATLDVS